MVECPHCGSINGAVKKAGALKIVHDKFRAKKTADDKERWKLTFARAVESQKELGSYLSKAVHEDLNPAKVLSLFRRISDEVSQLRLNLPLGVCRSLQFTSGLRTPRIAFRIRETGTIYLAIHIRSSCLHSSLCGSGWSFKRGRYHRQTDRDSFHKRTHKTRDRQRCSNLPVHGMSSLCLVLGLSF